MKLIVGLGNPGPKYVGTRHNVGFEIVDALAGRYDIDLSREKFHAWFGQGRLRETVVALLKPTTYMNRSGQAVAAAGRFFKLELTDMLIVADDIALPLGKLRVRAGGSAGSHNGLQNVIDRLGSTEWCRLRVGIGAPIGDPSVYVLSRFRADEQPVIDEAIGRSVDAIACWAAHGPGRVMNEFNG